MFVEPQPLPAESQPEVAYQMALYADESARQLDLTRKQAANTSNRLLCYGKHILALDAGDPRYLTLDNELTIEQDGLIVVGTEGIQRQLEMKAASVLAEREWVSILERTVHYRALHGRYDYQRGVDNSDFYNSNDIVVLGYKRETLAGTSAPDVPVPDAMAINDLLEAGGLETAVEAYYSISADYSPKALELLQQAGIAHPDLLPSVFWR